MLPRLRSTWIGGARGRHEPAVGNLRKNLAASEKFVHEHIVTVASQAPQAVAAIGNCPQTIVVEECLRIGKYALHQPFVDPYWQFQRFSLAQVGQFGSPC